MDLLYERAAGLDVHRDTVAVSVRVPRASGRDEHRRTYKTMTRDLLALRDWLKAFGVTHVAIESTGIYWRPVFYMLETDFTVILVNPAHVKNVPGRKTDMKDCSWLSRLMECGLLEASFIPPEPIRDLRDLTRYRTELSQERTRCVLRLHKFLQDAGIKLSSVATNIMGKSGVEMMQALTHGTKDPEILADLAKGLLRKKMAKLRLALEGRFRDHHSFMISELLAQVDQAEEAVERITQRIEEVTRPFAAKIELLRTVPGVETKAAQILVAEIGTKIEQFPSANHLASWAGMCPGNNESAQKRKRGKARKGNKWLRTILVQAAWGAVRTRDTAAGAQFRRLRVRLGNEKKALFAVAHTLLVSIYHMFKRNEPYKELGAKFYDTRAKAQIQRSCIKRLESLGFNVTLAEREAS